MDHEDELYENELMDEEEFANFDDWVPCPDFCNQGIIIICCDDMCAGMNHCIHGDGEAICETCGGEG